MKSRSVTLPVQLPVLDARQPSGPSGRMVCPHLPPCPGCPRFGENSLPIGYVRDILELAVRAGIEAEWVTGERTGFRRRARLAVRGRVGRPKIGIFEEGTHRVVDIPNCVIHHPVINDVARALKRGMGKLQLSSYSENAGLGLVRGLQVAVAQKDDTAQVVLIANDTSMDSSLELLGCMALELGPRLQGLYWNGNAENSNRVLGVHFKHFAGEPFLVEEFGGAQAFLGPGAFGQNNTELFSKLVEGVHGWVPAGARVVEYYAGVGTLGLGLVEHAASVCFNEVAEASLAGLARGIEALPELVRARASVFPGPAAAHVALLAQADVVVVDPPRKGLEPELLNGLVANPPERLIYVSCGFESFKRECAELSASFRLAALHAYDLFPYTEHVETVALFERR